MAARGRKPKPTHLHVIDGTLRGDRHKRDGEPEPDGRPVKPKKLKGRKSRASEIWDEIIERADWLSWADGPKAHVFCVLMAEFEKAPLKMPSARITQIRTLGSELGLDPSSRARIGGEGNRGKKDDPLTKYD